MSILSAVAGRSRRQTAMPAPVLDFWPAVDGYSSRIGPTPSFSRAGSASYIDSSGNLATAATNVPRITHDPATLECLGFLTERTAGTNLLLNSDTLATQSVTVEATTHVLHFTGTGTVTLSGAATGTLVGTGTGEANRVGLAFTPTAGSLTLTVSGNVLFAQLEASPIARSYISNSGSVITRPSESGGIGGGDFSGIFNPSKGTLYVEAEMGKFIYSGNNYTQAIFGVSSYNHYPSIAATARPSDLYVSIRRPGSANIANILLPPHIRRVRVAASYDMTMPRHRIASNGVLSNYDTTSFTLTASGFVFGGNYQPSQSMTLSIIRACYWPDELSSAQLLSLSRVGPQY